MVYRNEKAMEKRNPSICRRSLLAPHPEVGAGWRLARSPGRLGEAGARSAGARAAQESGRGGRKGAGAPSA